jgi:drug/metabolite transporter (DMT)-like permease
MKLNRSQWQKVILLGFVGMLGYHVLFFAALKYTSASSASMLAATNPIMTAVLLSIFYKERLSFSKIGFLLIALLGVVLTITNWQVETLLQMDRNIGELIMVLAVFCWACYSIMVKKFIGEFKPIVMTAYAFLTCTMMVFPFALFEGLIETSRHATISAWGSVIYMALFASVIGYWIQQESIQKIGPSKTNIFINLVPVFSLALAFLLLGERIPYTKLLSGGMIILAVVGFNLISIKSVK